MTLYSSAPGAEFVHMQFAVQLALGLADARAL